VVVVVVVVVVEMSLTLLTPTIDTRMKTVGCCFTASCITRIQICNVYSTPDFYRKFRICPGYSYRPMFLLFTWA